MSKLRFYIIFFLAFPIFTFGQNWTENKTLNKPDMKKKNKKDIMLSLYAGINTPFYTKNITWEQQTTFTYDICAEISLTDNASIDIRVSHKANKSSFSLPQNPTYGEILDLPVSNNFKTTSLVNFIDLPVLYKYRIPISVTTDVLISTGFTASYGYNVTTTYIDNYQNEFFNPRTTRSISFADGFDFDYALHLGFSYLLIERIYISTEAAMSSPLYIFHEIFGDNRLINVRTLFGIHYKI